MRLRPADPPPPTLALVAAVALAEAALGMGAHGLHLKWPNDLMRGTAKVAGILLERAGDWVVIGFGVNLAEAPAVPGRTTACLADMIGAIPPARALETLAAQFATRLEDWRGDLDLIAQRWVALAHPVGTALRVAIPDGEAIDGRFDGLQRDGALQLRLADGTSRVIHAGDIFEI